MPVFNELLSGEPKNRSLPTPHFRKPDDCSISVCSAIALYERELERHRATEDRLREMVLRESELLRQKDEIMRRKQISAEESEHRLLNGLQLINSVLSMQSRAAKNPETAAQLMMAANRVATLAHIHHHLHSLGKLKSVQFKNFLEKLCGDLSAMVPDASAERSIQVEGIELQIPRVTATPLAFIASELITNSIKHATGKTVVRLQTTSNGHTILSICDDGPGLPKAFDPAAPNGLGMRIVAALVRQIDGALSFTKGERDQGTCFSVLFKHQGEDAAR